jgi:acetate kinase
VATLLNERSGLLGVSGISDNVRVREALDLFAFRIVREAGSLIAALGGLDTFVFTGGIGEHAAHVRAAVCRGLAFAGIALDADANTRDAADIADRSSTVQVRIVPADEAREIARMTGASVRRCRDGEAVGNAAIVRAAPTI